jgi:hypothetical protein
MRNTALSVLVLASMGATSAMATPISGLGDPLSDPALVGGTQEGFDAVASGLYSSLTLGNVRYEGIGADFTIRHDFNGFYNTSGGQSLFNDCECVPDGFRFSFSTVVDAFAFNWGASDNTWVLRAFDVGGFELDSVVIAPVFGSNLGDYFGIAAAGIAVATLTDRLDRIAGGDYVFIDRFTTIGDGAVAVPEPSTLVLLGLGLLGFAASRRLSRSQ